jgi:glycosyltransferase involved in cell wall biosynthesis
MRIAHVVLSPPTRASQLAQPNNIQGDQRHVFSLAETQIARGMSAAVVTDSSGLFTNWCEQHGMPVFVADDLHPRGELTPSTSIFAGKIREFGADIVHYHNILAAKATLAAANSLKVSCIITMHTHLDAQTIRGLISAKRAGQEFAVVTVCKEEFEIMQKNNMAGIDLHYVPNGTKMPSGTDRQERRESTRPNLVLVGSLEHRKGIDIAILAMLELRRKRGPHCPVLNIYGEGNKSHYYLEMTKVLGLRDVVKFQGLQLDILDKCPSSDVLIVASRAETGPLVVLEAMSRGMPIVTTNVGDVNDMLPDQQYGRVVPVESITELADAIDATLADVSSGRFNPDLLVKRHRAQYSIEKMADRIEDVYRSALLADGAARRALS